MALAALLEEVVPLVGALSRRVAEPERLPSGRSLTGRCGVKRPIIRSRAYRLRDIEDVEVRVQLDADPANVAIALSEAWRPSEEVAGSWRR